MNRYEYRTCYRCGESFKYDRQEDEYIIPWDGGENRCQHNFDHPDNPFQLNSQNYRLYEALTRGNVTNADMVRRLIIFKYTSRISDVRRFLEGFGLSVVCRKVGDDGLHVYQMV